MLSSDLERILNEQSACAEYLAGNGPDKRGAWAGLCDWIAEEAIVCSEET